MVGVKFYLKRSQHEHNLSAHFKTHFRGSSSFTCNSQQPRSGRRVKLAMGWHQLVCGYKFACFVYILLFDYFCLVSDLMVDHMAWGSVHNGSVDNHHLHHHDPDPGPGRHSCPRCGRTYKWKQTLLRHVKYECGVEPQFICPICRAPFHHRNVLQRHMNLHSRPK